MANIYGYFDLSEYLRDDFEERKQRNPKYSLHAMAEKLDLNSSTVIRLINGKRGITKTLIPRFVSYLGLRHKETEYFAKLVVFNRAKTEPSRNAAYRALVELRNGRTHTVTEERYAFYEEWYFSAVRELLRFYPFTGNYQELARILDPPITAHQAKRAVELLVKLGFVSQVGDVYVTRENNISTGDQWEGSAVHNFQKTMTQKGVEAVDRFSKKERDVSTMTMCYSEKGLTKVRELLRQTRQELTRIEEADKSRNKVFQFNLQMFPLSKAYKGSKQ